MHASQIKNWHLPRKENNRSIIEKLRPKAKYNATIKENAKNNFGVM
jgi:hypothetical protein